MPAEAAAVFKPRYQAVAELIGCKIASGGYGEGALLESERELARSFGVSTIVINRAMSLLAAEGLVKKIPRKGNVVARVSRAGSGALVKARGAAVGPQAPAADSAAEAPSFFRRKTITVAVLSELPRYNELWSRVFRDYCAVNTDLEIRLAPVGGMQELYAAERWKSWDIVQIPGNLLPYYAGNGFLYRLGEIGPLEIADDQYTEGLLRSISWQGRLWGVPVSASLYCDFYDLRMTGFLGDALGAGGFWNRWDRIAEKSVGIASGSGRAMTFLHRHLFHLLVMAGADATCSYDKMRRFSSKGHVRFVERFERYIRKPGVFYQKIEGSAEYVPYIEKLLDRLSKGDFFILPGTSVFLSDIMQGRRRLRHGIMPAATEAGGSPVLETNLNVISHYTSYPEECLQILRYLASFETQKRFAENGRTVCNIRALEHLRIAGLDSFSLGNLRDGLSRGRIISSSDRNIFDYWSTVVTHEMIRWQTGKISGPEMLDALRRKTEFYYRSIERRNSSRSENNAA